ncbi:MAG: thioredoxin family protein [Deltaproteobacteria bacterium]|nr:thioredoxin family protein [Deltaproteobacteria bacterium]
MEQSRQIRIGGNTVGIIDLDEIFSEVRAAGVKGDKAVKQLIIEKVKVKNYVPLQLEDMYREDLFDEYRVFTGQQASRTRKPGVPEIRVYGPGCPLCEQLDRLVMEVIARKGLQVDYRYIKDIREMMKLGLMGTPALVINGKLIAVGRVPNSRELEEILKGVLPKLNKEVCYDDKTCSTGMDF